MAKLKGKVANAVLLLFLAASIYTYTYVAEQQSAIRQMIQSEETRHAAIGLVITPQTGQQLKIETENETETETENDIEAKQKKAEMNVKPIKERVNTAEMKVKKIKAEGKAPQTNTEPKVDTINQNETNSKDKNDKKEKSVSSKNILRTYNPKQDPQITNCTKGKMVVPNIVHWTWFYDEAHTVSWIAYISMLSAIRIQKAEAIYVWCTTAPVGKYWDAVLEEANETNVDIQIRHMKPPDHIHNITIHWKAHQSDIVRLEKLRDYGGIYMDLDVIILKSFEPLMCYDLTLGRERNVKLNNGIMLSKKNPAFFTHWFELYRNYDNKCWDCQNVYGPNGLAKKYPELLHIEQTTMNRPGFAENKYLYSKDLRFDWSNNYCVHTWYREHKKEYTPESIKTLDMTIGQLFRFIYYGSGDKIFD